MNNALRNSIARPSLRAAVNSQDLVIDSGAATSLRPVQPGHCLDMVAASSQYIDSGVTVTGGTAVDISFTINPDSVTGGIFKSGGWLAGNKGLTLSMASGAVLVSSSDGTTLGSVGFTGLTLVTGAWYEGRLVWDGATSAPTLTIITGGVSTDYVASGTIAGWVGASAQNLRFGDTAFSYFDGKLGFCKYDGVLQYNNDFSSGTVAIDSSGNGNDGTLVNGPTWTTDNSLPYSWLNQVGYSQRMYLDGTDDNIGLGTASNLQLQAADTFEIECDIMFSDSTAVNTIVGWREIGGPSDGWQFRTEATSGVLRLLLFDGAAVTECIGTTDVVDGSKHTVKVTYDGAGTFALFIDGGSETLASSQNNAGSVTYTNSEAIIGSYTTAFSQGIICDLSYTKGGSLVSSYIGNGNTDADWTDQTGINDGTVNGSPDNIFIPRDEATPANDAFGNALQWSGSAFPRRPEYRGSYAGEFDGVNDYVSTTTAPITGELTAWVKTTDDNGCVIGSQAGSNRCYLQIRSGVLGGGLGSVSYVTMFGTITVNDGAWHLVSMTWDGSNTRLFVDGVLDGTYSQSGTVEQTLPLYIGGLNSNSSFAAPLTFDASGVNITSAEYPLAEGVGSTVHDISGNGNDGTITNASTATEGAGFWAGRIDGEANAHNINNGFSRRMLFDGVNDYVSFDLGTFNTSAWSVKATFAFNDLSSNQDIFSQAAGSGTGRAWVRIGTNGNATTFLGGAGSTVIAPSSTFAVGGVYVIELVYSLSPDTLTLIVDGVSQTPVSRTCEVSTGLFYLGTGHSLGQYSSGTAYNATLNGSTYTGNGNTDADWLDTVGSNNGTVNGSPALLRVPADSAAPTLDVYGSTLTNPAVANSHNDAETTWDFENIGTGDTIAPETSHLSNFDAVTFSDTNYSLGTTSPIDSVFWRDKSGVLKDRATGYGATLTGVGLVYANNYTDGERWNNLAPWDDDNIWND